MYPNDQSFKYCQSCGKKNEESLENNGVGLTENISAERLRYLDNLLDNRAYAKKKSSLQKELENFLGEYNKSLGQANPEDLRKFLVNKDKRGKTQVHHILCSNLGKIGKHDCGCPLRLAWGTIQSIIGQVKAIFESNGKGSDWDEVLLVGNPASSIQVSRYLEAVKREQSMSHVPIKQAKPLFLDKLKMISEFISSKLQNSMSLSERFTYLRDQAFFKLQFFAGDRAGDLGKCLGQEVKLLPNGEGFVFVHTTGKTLCGKVNEFAVKKLQDESVCPVKGLQFYVSEAKKMGIALSVGYLFRPLDKSNTHVLDLPLTSSAVYSRLKLYLKTLKIDEGETPHSIRGGCAVTLAVTGCGNEREIMDHVGWFSKDSYLRYSRMEKIVDRSSVSSRFQNVLNTPNDVASVYDKFGDTSCLPQAFH